MNAGEVQVEEFGGEELITLLREGLAAAGHRDCEEERVLFEGRL
jgi:hypothetical protein